MTLARLAPIALGALLATTSARAQDQEQTIPIRGDRLSGFVLPIEPISADLDISALRAHAWTVDDTQRLLLHGDVRIRLGLHTFTSSDAAVWINRLPSAEGLINQVAVYFDKVGDPVTRAGIGVAGQGILVTGSVRGAVRLHLALLQEQPPARNPLLSRGEERVAQHLARLLATTHRLQHRPGIDRPEPPAEFQPQPGGTLRRPQEELPTEVTLPGAEELTLPLFVPEGTVRLAAEQIQTRAGERENVILASGSIVVEYASGDLTADWSQLTLAAERAVIFTDPGPVTDLEDWQFDAGSIRGIYLEGNVSISVDRGAYTVRAPQVYYDVDADQAIMVDALLHTYLERERVPIYARAQELRQVAADQWTARKARVSTSEFFTPHIAIGAERVTITQRPAADRPGARITHVDSEHNTLLVGGMPVFYWPRFSGDVRKVPLQRFSVGSRKNDGVRIRTAWDLHTIGGVESPPGVDSLLLLDGYTERGGAVGVEHRYDTPGARGVLDLYGLFDEGTDRTSSGLEVVPRHEIRGVALWEHQMPLSRFWSLQAQAAYISDPSFLSAWRERDFADRREYETSVSVKGQRNHTAFTALAQFEINPFIANSDLLASRQYKVDRMPELTLRGYGQSLFGDRVTYSGETRLTRMRLVFDRSTPRELGVPGAAFGLGPDDRISDALRARGLRTNFVTRFDTRHEFAMPMQFGAVKATPFIVGRYTGYAEDEFEDFSSDSDNSRVFGAAGIRLATQLQRIDNTVESRLFDLHRLRHIIEPSVILWAATANVSEDDLPEYDAAVESLGTGTIIRAGLRNTWQTYRGGPGRWRSVDVLALDASVVLGSDDVNRESPTPQFFDYRPEYSQFGDHARATVVWLLSDALSVVGDGTWDLEDDLFTRSSIGVELRHSPLLTTFVEYRVIDAGDTELIELEWQYMVTKKYRVSVRPQWDFQRDEFRNMTILVTRRFPDFDLVLHVNRDEIRDDTTFGASIGLVEF